MAKILEILNKIAVWLRIGSAVVETTKETVKTVEETVKTEKSK